MTENVPASLITVEFAQTMHIAAGARWRQANADIHRFALLATALLIRREYPTATHLWLEPSDQGPYMTPTVIVDPECGFDDDEIEEYPAIQDQLWTWVNDLDEEDPWGLWSPFTYVPVEGGRHAALDLDLILFHEGNSEAVLAERQKFVDAARANA